MRSRILGLGLLPLLATYSSVATKQPKSDNTSYRNQRVAGAFLTLESKEKLLSQIKPKHSEVVEKPAMVISYKPEGPSLAKVASQLGRPVDLLVRTIISDEHAQAAVVEIIKIATDDDGGVPYVLANSIPHITISVLDDSLGYGPFYSNILIARAREASGGLDKSWKGTLPAQNGYERSHCEVYALDEPLIVSATLCLSDLWNLEKDRCGEEGCGFCRFMKLGPCEHEFTAWENCIDSCKETDEDFIDKCKDQTLALKQCVDAHPEYYYSVLGEENENEEENESEGEREHTIKEKNENMLIEVDPNAKVEIFVSEASDSIISEEN